jgi:plastocyanin domain-containing protein
MLVLNLLGLGLIALIVWWFWLYKPPVTTGAGNTEIVVENGVYSPARLQLTAEQPAVLHFLRKDKSPCAEMVVFPDLDISVELAVDKTIDVKLPPLSKGEYAFTCQMQMYRGTLVVA